YRVKIAEEAFRKISSVRVKWLSCEPLLELLQFTDLTIFDLVVIGAQSRTVQPDGTVVPEVPASIESVARLIVQAREADCGIWCKSNLLSFQKNLQSPGMKLIQEMPRTLILPSREAAE